jgi:hypothetical protein
MNQLEPCCKLASQNLGRSVSLTSLDARVLGVVACPTCIRFLAEISAVFSLPYFSRSVLLLALLDCSIGWGGQTC